MMKFKKLSVFIISAVMAAGITSGCQRSDIIDNTVNNEESSYANFTMPADGEEIAVLSIKDYGTVKVKLFPEYAPKGVENFKGLAEMGYYDGLTFHRVLQDFCIQGGDPDGVGTGGSSIWGEDFEIEPSDKLYHFKGALAYARPQTGGNSSQFYFVMGSAGNGVNEEIFDSLASQGYKISKDVREKYLETDGAYWLDGQYTIFGQVIEGMDILEKINTVTADESGMPETPVVMESVKIEKYSAE